MRHLFLLQMIVLVAVVFLNGSCSAQIIDPGSCGRETDIRSNNQTSREIIDDELKENRELWQKRKILNYDFTLSLYASGFTPPARPVLLKVRIGQNIAIEKLSFSDTRSTMNYEIYDSTEKIFDAIEEQIAIGNQVKASFNNEMGFPAEVYFDFSKQAHGAYNKLKITSFDEIRSDKSESQ